MPGPNGIDVLLLDIGGVLLTNGWDRHARARAAETFGLDREEMDERHNLTFDTYEEGKLSLEEYLRRVVFHRRRAFSAEQFKRFMFEQTKPHGDAIDFFSALGGRGVRIGAVSNEGRELTMYRIETFGLRRFMQFIIASCFVHFRKPDEDIYRLALDVAQVAPDRAAYVDDRAMYVEVAAGMGIRGICHTSLDATRRALAGLGLEA